jgi:very-short-patch-repair endonuclease
MRDETLRRAGYRVLRFANPEIDPELDAVMDMIVSALKSVDPTRLLALRGATLGEG